MTPQLVGLSPGVHNENLDTAAARIMASGAWKRQRVVVILPAAAQMPSKAALALWNLYFPPNNGVVRILAQGMEVGEAYSQAIEQVLANPDLRDWEYLLTVEHDNIPPPDGVVRLIETMEANPEYSCVGGLYFTKGPEGVPQIWGDPTDPVLNYRPQVPRPGQVQECCGTGMGFNLWRLPMFKDDRLKRPWFKTLCSATEGLGTQDLAFWSDARKHGYRCAIDNRVLVGHYDHQHDITW
jgi:hypothetical protein